MRATLDDELRAFVGSAPPGAARAVVERYREHTGKSRAGAVIDDLFGPDGEGEDAPPPAGLRLAWQDAEGRPLRAVTRHPIDTALEDALLPALTATARAAGAKVEIVARHRALTAAPRVVDQLVALSARGPQAESAAGYRGSAGSAVPEALLGPLRVAGFEVLSPRWEDFALERRRVRERAPGWLLFIPLILFFSPVLIVVDRGITGVLRMLRETFTRAVRTQEELLRYRVAEGALSVEARGARAVPAVELALRIPVSDILALGFGPAAFVHDDRDRGRLRVVLSDRVETLPHDVAAPDAPNALAGAEGARRVGAALRALVVELAAHRMLPPGPS